MKGCRVPVSMINYGRCDMDTTSQSRPILELSSGRDATSKEVAGFKSDELHGLLRVLPLLSNRDKRELISPMGNNNEHRRSDISIY